LLEAVEPLVEKIANLPRENRVSKAFSSIPFVPARQTFHGEVKRCHQL